MKFNVSSNNLFSHLQTIGRVINSKNATSILDCFLMEVKDGVLYITASDKETTLITKLEIFDYQEEGRFAISAKNLLDALKELPEQPLTFNVNTTTFEVVINYNNDGRYAMMCMNADEYPAPIEPSDDKVSFSIPAQTLLAGVSSTLFATADDDLRPVMNGVYFDINTEHLVFVASDGHKLVRYTSFETKSTERAAFILPKKPANLLKSLLPKEQGDVEVSFDSQNAVFQMSNFKMVCLLIDGRFPNYNSVIPNDNPYQLVLNRAFFLSALRRISVFSSASSNMVKLNCQADQMKLSAQDIDFSTSAEETLACQYNGPEISIGFKASFLIDILSNLGSEEVTIHLADPSRAGVIVPTEQDEKSEVLMLLMPMMLND